MIEVECRIFIKKDKQIYLDQTKINLLLHIQQNGSLRSAAKTMGISYQHAWNLINDMNTIAAEPLIIKQRGGTSGGGATLTSSGLRVLNEYHQIEKQVNSFVKQINAEINM